MKHVILMDVMNYVTIAEKNLQQEKNNSELLYEKKEINSN